MISSRWYGHTEVDLTTGEALRALGSILNWTGPKRLLVNSVGTLQYQIITGGDNVHERDIQA